MGVTVQRPGGTSSSGLGNLMSLYGVYNKMGQGGSGSDPSSDPSAQAVPTNPWSDNSLGGQDLSKQLTQQSTDFGKQMEASVGPYDPFMTNLDAMTRRQSKIVGAPSTSKSGVSNLLGIGSAAASM